MKCPVCEAEISELTRGGITKPIPRLRPLRGQSPSPFFAPTGSERIGICSAAPAAAAVPSLFIPGSAA